MSRIITLTRMDQSFRYIQYLIKYLTKKEPNEEGGDVELIEEEVLDEDGDLPNSASDMKKKKIIRRARKLDPNNPEDLERLLRRKERIK